MEGEKEGRGAERDLLLSCAWGRMLFEVVGGRVTGQELGHLRKKRRGANVWDDGQKT